MLRFNIYFHGLGTLEGYVLSGKALSPARFLIAILFPSRFSYTLNVLPQSCM